eukprot:GHVR01192135.1.p1 GENE.GHVR01192135.1~~GHVR01192135.1.p1  ORF type:complete len:133 (+),score=65.08 GHVR01192135.1:166-564(+)
MTPSNMGRVGVITPIGDADEQMDTPDGPHSPHLLMPSTSHVHHSLLVVRNNLDRAADNIRTVVALCSTAKDRMKQYNDVQSDINNQLELLLESNTHTPPPTHTHTPPPTHTHTSSPGVCESPQKDTRINVSE